MIQPDVAQLHQFLLDYFNLEELKTLCFKLGIEFEDLAGEGRAGKARELVLLMKRQLRVEYLIAQLTVCRPDAYQLRFPKKLDVRIHEKTGIELIRIPGGEFIYGSLDSTEVARLPSIYMAARTVFLPEYWISRTPITNAQYKRFLDERPQYGVPYAEADRARPYNWDKNNLSYPTDRADHPVTLVTGWGGVFGYCGWAGLDLPTEEQWEKAARGFDGRMWPWGNEQPTSDHCNFGQPEGSTTPVGIYSPIGDSPYGCADMAGNVVEWAGKWGKTGPDSKHLALRGGSFSFPPSSIRTYWRIYMNALTGKEDIGFRVVDKHVPATIR